MRYTCINNDIIESLQKVEKLGLAEPSIPEYLINEGFVERIQSRSGIRYKLTALGVTILQRFYRTSEVLLCAPVTFQIGDPCNDRKQKK